MPKLHWMPVRMVLETGKGGIMVGEICLALKIIVVVVTFEGLKWWVKGGMR